MTDDGPIANMIRTVPRMSREFAVRYAKVPGISIAVTDRCVGCGICVKKGFCRFGAISVVNKKASINTRSCRHCGRCTHLCPRNALAIELRPPSVVSDVVRQVDKEISKFI